MQASGCAVIRQSHFIAVVGAFLMGCTVLLMVVGCAGVRSEAPQKKEQAHTEATASEEARCEGTRTFKDKVILCGADNPYGHPTPETLDRLQRTGAKIFRNDEHGDVIVTIKDQKVDVAVTKPEAAI